MLDPYDGDRWVGALTDDDVATAGVEPYRPIFGAQPRER